MILKEAKLLGVKYCKENNCNYTYISYDDTSKFYLTDREDKNVVFYINKNGSLHAYRATPYAANFHKELARRKNNRRNNGKRKIADIHNRDYEVEVEE